MHGGGSTGTAAAKHASRLRWALALTGTYMIAEVVGALVTGSLALLADAAAMGPVRRQRLPEHLHGPQFRHSPWGKA